MNARSSLRLPHRPAPHARAGRGLLVALAPLVVLAGAGCGSPDQFLPPSQSGAPKAAIDGTVTYTGPLPCTENGHIVGAAVLLVFDVQKLPPPEGIGTTAASLAAVGGDELFAGIRGRLTFNADKTRACPAPGLPPVTVSAPWVVAPLDAGTYQIRGFYDLDGNFDPAFSIANLPTKGDIAGGALENAADAALGSRPVYREITLGIDKGDGTRVIPELGVRIGGIAVNLGLALPLERPVFYPKAVLDETKAANKDPLAVTMPSDFQLTTFKTSDPQGTEQSFIRITLAAGVAPDEADAAAQKPFNLPPKSPAPTFLASWQDVNGDGQHTIAGDHIPDAAQIPSLSPIAIFTKIDAKRTDKPDLVQQTDPTVLLLGLTLYKSLLGTALSPPTLHDATPEVIIALRPAALCLPADPARAATLVVSRKTDTANNPILTDEGSVKAALKAQFKRPIDLTYGCLPEGRYAMNLIYETGQAWTVPNEAGLCSSLEPPTADGKTCVSKGTTVNRPSRARLVSQSAALTIGPPTDPTYCKELPPACAPAQASR